MGHGLIKVILRHLPYAIILFIFAAILWVWTQNAWADDDGFFDRWPGKIVVRVTVPGNPPTAVPKDFGNIEQTFDSAWSIDRDSNGKTVRDRICEGLQSQIEHTKWLGCNVGIGELRAKSLSQNLGQGGPQGGLLYLQYVVSNNSIFFESPTDLIFGSYIDPTIHGNFDLALDVAIAFDSDVGEGAGVFVDSQQHPAKVTTTRISFKNAHFTADQVYVPPNRLRDGEARLNASGQNLANLPFVPDMNAQIKANTPIIAQFLNVGLFGGFSGATANSYFALGISTDPENLFLDFRKDASAPAGAPSQCRTSPLCSGIDLSCDGVSGATIYYVVNADPQSFGSWTADPPTSPEARINASPGQIGKYRMCAANKWGSICSDAISATSGGACTPGDPSGPWPCRPRPLINSCPKLKTPD